MTRPLVSFESKAPLHHNSETVHMSGAQKSAFSHITRGVHLLPVEEALLARSLASAALEVGVF